MHNAIVMQRYGPPSVLALAAVESPPLRDDEIRMRTLASAINHSDLGIRAGKWPVLHDPPFPYTPGLAVVGEVIEVGRAVANFRAGQRVFTMMPGLGGVRAERPGGYAEQVIVAASSCASVSNTIDPLDIAALGLASVTAFGGLRKIEALRGKRILVTGAAGGVGGAAVSIAKAEGAHVIATVSRASQAEYVRSIGADEVMTRDEIDGGALPEHSVDGVLDHVGGSAFGKLVAALRKDGVLSLVGAVAGREVMLDAYQLTEATLTGYSSESLDGAQLRTAVATIVRMLAQGRLPTPTRNAFALREAAAAHDALEQHNVSGRLLLLP